MADAFRGLTIRLGADARPLNQAISSISRSASAAQKQLSAMNKVLQFDPTNIAAMSARLSLMGDKAEHAAKAARLIRTAMNQVDDKTKSLAASTKSIYAATQEVRSSYNHVDAELQHIYDGVRKVVAAEKGWAQDSEELDTYMKNLKRNYGGTTKAAKALTAEMQAYVRAAHMQHGTGDAFGLSRTFKDSKKLVNILERLRASQKELDSELSAVNAAEGYRAMQTQLIAYESELRQAAAETVRFRSEIYSLGSLNMVGLVNEASRLDEMFDKATAAAKRMDAAFKKVPKDVEAARAKMSATAHAEEIMAEKARNYEAILKDISTDSAFSKQLYESMNVYTWLSRVTGKAQGMEAKLADANDRVKAITESMKEAATKFGKGSNKVKELAAQLKEARAEVKQTEARAAELNEELRQANQAKKYVETKQDLVALKAEMAATKAQASRLQKALDFMKNIRTAGYGLYSTLTPAIMMAGRYAIQAADEIDSAYRDMRKTVNGTEEEFESLRQSALDFSTTHVTSPDKILEIEAIGGQLGIAASNLDEFAETVSNLDVATNIDAEAVAEQLGKMATVLNLDVTEYDNFGDALVRLGNNMPVMESDITTLMTRFMGMGKVVGMSYDEMLAWSAAASATGQKSEAAGSSMQRFISKMETAVVNGGDQLEGFARIAGVSADEFANAFKTDASDAMYQFIRGLGDMQKRGESVNQALGDLKINNVRDKQLLEGLAVQMANGTEQANVLKTALEMASDAAKGLPTSLPNGTIEEAGDAAREAARKAEGFSGQLDIMRNNAMTLASELAEGATPIVKGLATMFQGATDAIRNMAPEMKSAIVTVAGVLASLGPAMVGLGALGAFVDKIVDVTKAAAGAKTIKNLVGLSNTVKALSIQTGLVGQAARAIAPAFAAVGAAPIVAGVAALAAVIGTIVSYSTAAVERGNKLREATNGYVDAVKGAKDVTEILAVGTDRESDTLDRLVANYGKYAEAAEKQTQKNIDLANSFKQQEASAETTAALIQRYSDTIIELAGHCDGDAAKIALLETAISQYNQLTGSNIQMVNEFSGAIDHQTEAIEKNTEAAKLNAYAKAYQEMLVEGIKAAEETSIAIQGAAQEYADATAEIDRLTAAGKAYNMDGTPTDELLKAQVAATEATNSLNELTPQYDKLNEANDVLTEKLGHVKEAANGNATEYQRLKYQMMDYENALKKSGKSFYEYLDLASELQLGVNELAAELSGAGISAQEFANLGKDGFDRVLAAANGDFSQIRAAIDLLNEAGIDPKTMTVTEEGIEDAEGKLWKLDVAAGTITDGEKVLHVGVQGAEQATQETDDTSAALENLDGQEATAQIDEEGGQETRKTIADDEEAMSGLNGDTATVYLEARDNANAAIDSVRRNLQELDGKSATVTINKVGGDAAGGFYALHAAGGRYRLHGSGGFITSGPTYLGMDAQGFMHIAGEAGREWVKRHADGTTSIVPIENKRYLKPYARDIASMIQGPTYDDSYLIAEIRSLHEDIASMQVVLNGKAVGRAMAPEMNRQLSRLEVANAR